MVQINNVNTQKFSLNGVEYFKNFTPVVVGNRITIVNTYDSKIVIVPLTEFQDFEVDAVSYASVVLLQSALLPVVFTRDSLGASGYVQSIVAGTNITVDNTDPLNPIVSSTGSGGGDEFHYIHLNQYIQYNQAPTTWYSRSIGPQNVGWHTSVNQHANSIGTNPLSFSSASPSVIIPFDCEVVESFVTIQNSNGNNRVLNLRFYVFDYVGSSGTPANIESMLDISTLSLPGNKVITTDFTIPANTFTKGQHVTSVTNQSSNLTGVAVSWDVLIKLRKI